MNQLSKLALLGTMLLAAHALAGQSASPAPTGLRVGDKAPAIEGRDHRGEVVSLATLLKQGPVIVTFYRGYWCPFCNRYLKKLQDSVAAVGGRVIAVTPEKPEFASQVAEKNGTTYPLVSDVDGSLLSAYKVGFEMDPTMTERMKSRGMDLVANHGGRTQLPVPATYVVGTDGRIRYVHFNTDYKERATLTDLSSSSK